MFRASWVPCGMLKTGLPVRLQDESLLTHAQRDHDPESHSQGMPRHATPSPAPGMGREGAGDISEDLDLEHEKDGALWMASNRPMRSKEWPSQLDLALQPFSEDCTPDLGHADLFETILSPPTGPGPQDLSPSLTHATCSSSSAMNGVDLLGPSTFYILPDVPVGLESVDELARQIPIHPWQPQHLNSFSVAGHPAYPAHQS